MDIIKKRIVRQPKPKALKELEPEIEPFTLAMSRLREIFSDYIKMEPLNGKEVEIIVFFDDTLENAKPIFDKHKKAIEFNQKDKDSRLFIYMPLDEFCRLFEPVLINLGEYLSDTLFDMINFDFEHNLGHDLFLNMVSEIRNPKPLITEICEPVEPKTIRKFY